MRYEKNSQVSVKTVDNEVFAFNRSNGVIHSFNGSGGFLMRLITEGRPFESLVAEMLKEYEVDEKTACEDIQAFLQELEEKGLVSIHDR
jgi:hypothetical protein